MHNRTAYTYGKFLTIILPDKTVRKKFYLTMAAAFTDDLF